MYNIDININNTGWVDVTVDNISPFSFEIERGKQFKRLSWGEISISNNPHTNGELFQDILDASYLHNIDISIDYGDFSVLGYFSKNDCTFDYDRRIIKVTPTTLDDFTDFLETYENEVDFNKYTFYSNPIKITLPPRTQSVRNDWDYDQHNLNNDNPYYYDSIYGNTLIKEEDEWVTNGKFDAYFNTNGSPNLSELSSSTVGFASTIASYTLNQRIDILLGDDYGDYILTAVTINESKTIIDFLTRKRYLHCVTEFSREEEIKEDVVDTSNPFGYESPDGNGWNMRDATFYSGKAAHLWTRTPLNQDAAFFSDFWELEDIKVVNLTDPQVVYRQQTTRIPIGTGGIEKVIDNPMPLKEMLNYYFRNIDDKFSDREVVSTFLFNNNEGAVTLLNGRPGVNYVTLNKNKLNNIVAINTSDIADIIQGDENLIKKYSLQTILDDLAILFDIYWFIDDQGNLRIEHIRYLDLTKVSLVVANSNLLEFTQNWSFDKSEMYSTIEYKQVNTVNRNFTDNEITFDKIVSNSRNKKSKQTNKTNVLSTDIAYAVLNPNDISDGIILVIIDDNRDVVNSIGLIDGLVQTNGDLAMPKLLADYHTYEGVWESGFINGVVTEFKYTSRTKISDEIIIKGIHDSTFYTTKLGVGAIDSGEIDLDRQTTKIKLKYRYNSTPEADTFALMAEESLDFYEAESVLIDLGVIVSYIIPSPSYYSFLYTAESKVFSLTGLEGIAWVASVNQAWVSITSSDSGTGNGSVTLLVEENPDAEYRFATLEITTVDSNRAINLTQKFIYPPSDFRILYLTTESTLELSLEPMQGSYSIENIGESATKTITITLFDGGGIITTITKSITLGYLESDVFQFEISAGAEGGYSVKLDTTDDTETNSYTVYIYE